MRTIQFTALALVLGAGVACKSKSDSGESGTTAATTGATGGGGASVGDGAGAHVVTIQDAACSVGWGLAGAYTGSGADYKWDVTLTLDSSLTDCSFGDNTAGKIEATGGKVYWGETAATQYVGAAGYNGTTLSWATNGYVTGGGGGTYAYDGNITW